MNPSPLRVPGNAGRTHTQEHKSMSARARLSWGLIFKLGTFPRACAFRPQAAGRLIHGISRDLRHPGFGGMPGNASQGHAPGFQMQEEEHVIGSQTSPGQHLHREEIRAGEDRQYGPR
jgi:hypothetical protein